MGQTRKRVTIVDVAQRAGASIGTVSRVLNGASCSSETRQRVREAIEALEYVPNHAARSLKRQTTEGIALVVPDIANPVYVAMAKAVQGAAKERGYRLSLVSTDGNSSEEGHALRSLEQKHVDGLILCSLRPTPKFVREIEKARERVCVIGGLPPHPRVDTIRVDSASGAASAVRHLAEGGRRCIALINGTAGTVPAEARERGYRRGLLEHHLPYHPDRVVHTDFTVSGGYSAVDALLAKGEDVDALFCANDVMALGALRRLRELGRRVPQDIALVGVDDIDLGRVSSPTLTSVSLLAGERGRLATEFLLERLGNPELEPREVVITPKLVIRESSTDYVVYTGGDHAPG